LKPKTPLNPERGSKTEVKKGKELVLWRVKLERLVPEREVFISFGEGERTIVKEEGVPQALRKVFQLG